MEAVQMTLPQVREKPVAGLQPVSRQRMETILPSEKKEGSSAETQEQLSTFSLHVWQSTAKSDPGNSRQESENGIGSNIINDKSDNTLAVSKDYILRLSWFQISLSIQSRHRSALRTLK